MARSKSRWVCTACGHTALKWQGRCGGCGAWNTLEEEAAPASVGSSATPPRSLSDRTEPIPLGQVDLAGGGEVRIRTGLGELDDVLGGGLVAGSLTLIGGDPGVGKSTLLLMAMDRFAQRGLPVLYVTGEESARQVRLRADRLGVGAGGAGEHLHLLAHTDFEVIERAVERTRPVVVVIDSVQTVAVPDAKGIPGSVSQVREVAHRAMLLAKRSHVAIVLVGHVTKSGDLAGPKVLEHFVDATLYFEGDGRTQLRILRAVKNRFGAAGELGLFEMADVGLVEVPDASARLLEERAEGAAGTSVVMALEGSRPLLAELQALVGPGGTPVPARTCVGVDRTRVLMLTAVLHKQGLELGDRDVFANAAGGVRLDEPAADLPLIAALASSLLDRPLPARTALVGEVGLVGEVRMVSQPALRLKEAARHGFEHVIVPARAAEVAPAGLEVTAVRTVAEALDRLGLG